MLTGNDIVDLRLEQNRLSAANPRYAQRVLAPTELAALEEVATAASRLRAFWGLWAAKETVYKSLRKTDPRLLFAPGQFVVDANAVPALASGLPGQTALVATGGTTAQVRWSGSEDWVHCISDAPGGATQSAVVSVADVAGSKQFLALQSAGTWSDESIAARVLAMRLLAKNGITGIEIVRERCAERRGPPLVVADGVHLRHVDISLSHDGRFAAAAIRILEQGARGRADQRA